jgi:hypothetical protein
MVINFSSLFFHFFVVAPGTVEGQGDLSITTIVQYYSTTVLTTSLVSERTGFDPCVRSSFVRHGTRDQTIGQRNE